MTSEHHGGFAGYLPNPLQMTSFILEAHPTGWAAACPLLLPLRPIAQLAEEVAWLAARHPGRVGYDGIASSDNKFANDQTIVGNDPTNFRKESTKPGMQAEPTRSTFGSIFLASRRLRLVSRSRR